MNDFQECIFFFIVEELLDRTTVLFVLLLQIGDSIQGDVASAVTLTNRRRSTRRGRGHVGRVLAQVTMHLHCQLLFHRLDRLLNLV